MSDERLEELEFRIEELEQSLLPKLMTPAQCADFLGFTQRTLYNLHSDGNGPPAIHISPRMVRYDVHAVMQWAKQREVA